MAPPQLQAAQSTSTQEITSGRTARFPFTVIGEGPPPTKSDFVVSSTNERFRVSWARFSRTISDDPSATAYYLHIKPPADVPHKYGDYEIRLRLREDEAESLTFVMRVRPCIRVTSRPHLSIGRSGNVEVRIALLNCGDSEVSVTLDLSHGRSGWTLSATVCDSLGPGQDIDLVASYQTKGRHLRASRFQLRLEAAGFDLGSFTIRPVLDWWRDPTHVGSTAAAVVAIAALSAGAAAFTTGHHVERPVSGSTTTATTAPPTTVRSTTTTSTSVQSAVTTAAEVGIRLPGSVACGPTAAGASVQCTVPVQAVAVSSGGVPALKITAVSIAAPPSPTSSVLARPWTASIGTCSNPLTVGMTCSLGVTFLPARPGPEQTVLTVHQNLPGPASAVTVTGATSAPTLTLSPSEGTAGQPVTATAEGFGVGVAVTFSYVCDDGSGSASSVAAADGQATATLDIPSSLDPSVRSSCTVTAAGPLGSPAATATFVFPSDP